MPQSHSRTADFGAEPAVLSGRSPGRNVLLAMSWYYPEMHHGVARFGRDHHWHITADFDDMIPKHFRGDGVITHLGARQNLWRPLRRLGVPVVDLSESRPEIRLPRATMDNTAIGKMAAEYFLNRGYRHFAYFHRWDLGVSRRRREAFAARVAEAGHPCQVLCWQTNRRQQPDTREQRHRWLKRRLIKLEQPIALFATRDIEAVEVIEACHGAGLEVPDQVAVLGVDNTEAVCDCLRVPLSSIDCSLEEIGYQSAALLDRLMSGTSPPDAPIYIPPRGVVERQSTDILATSHPAVAAALRFIHDKAHEPIGMKEVYTAVAMSRSGLEKAFRDNFVRAPMQELRRIRLERTKKLLRETDKKITAIALATGFKTPHRLCRTFKQQFGLTPKQYRLDCRQERQI